MSRRKDKMAKQLKSILILAAGLFLTTDAHSQAMCIDNQGNPCSAAEIRKKCAQEPIEPNLTVAKPTKLAGVLLDGTGSPVDFDKTMFGMKTIIQVRDIKTGAVLFSAPLLEDGLFDLGLIPAGQFRLLAVWAKGSELSRLPLADQPRAMSCTDTPECQVKAVIHFHGTDDFYDSCPPK